MLALEKEWIPLCNKIDLLEILKARGIKDEDIPLFIWPEKFAKEVEPDCFYGLRDAVKRTFQAILNNGSIMVVADVDADGVTSGAIVYNALYNYIHSLKRLDIVVGNRKVHGLAQHEIFSDYDLVIACDSGSDEYEYYKQSYACDTEIVILDHHKADHISEYAYIVNPEMNPVKNSCLSGSGVCLKFVEMLSEDWEFGRIPYDLATVGIIADMMDMRYEDNRAICMKGFDDVQNKGIKAALRGYQFNSDSVKFSIAPLVNAAQRMNRNDLALELFLDTTTQERCEKIVEELKACKAEQKVYVEEGVKRANIVEHDKFVFASIEQNEKLDGLSGLMATMISKDYQKPTIFLREEGDTWRGSIRTYGVPNLKTIINETNLAVSDGHEEAAGIRVEKENVQKFISELEKNLPDVQSKKIIVDVELDDLEELTLSNVEKIDKINEITGECFEPITIMVSGIEPDKVSILNGKHSKIICGNITLLLWNNTKPVDDWPRNKWRCFDIVGVPTISRYRMKDEINVIVSDIYYEVE